MKQNKYNKMLIVTLIISLFSLSTCTKNKAKSYYYIATGYLRLILNESDQKKQNEYTHKVIFYFEKSLAEDPTNSNIRSFVIKFYQSIVEQNPDNPVLHNNLAMLYATSKEKIFHNPQKALLHANKAMELTKGKEPFILDTLGEAYFANKNFQKAVDIEKKALELAGTKENIKIYQINLKRFKKALSGG